MNVSFIAYPGYSPGGQNAPRFALLPLTVGLELAQPQTDQLGKRLFPPIEFRDIDKILIPYLSFVPQGTEEAILDIHANGVDFPIYKIRMLELYGYQFTLLRGALNKFYFEMPNIK